MAHDRAPSPASRSRASSRPAGRRAARHRPDRDRGRQERRRNTAYYDGMEFAREVGLLPPQDSGAERAMKGAVNAVTKARRAFANERVER